MELKLRSLPVSGTKTDLIERLKSYRENSSIQSATAMETTATPAALPVENIKLSPPVSPIASKVSRLGIEDSSVADSPVSPQEEAPLETRCYERDSEKDKRLHEKERQIEELMRKLEQEQRLVEELKMQLEVEKRSQHGDSPPHLSPLAHVRVKEENRSPSTCSATCSPPALPALVKQEEVADRSPLHQSHFIISQQTVKQPGAQILLPASLPSIQLPASGVKLHTAVSSAAPGLIQTSGDVPQKIEASAALQQQCSTQPLTKVGKHRLLQSVASLVITISRVFLDSSELFKAVYAA